MLTIATAENRKSKTWINEKISWLDLINRLKKPKKVDVCMEEYFKKIKADQDSIKDVGGFIGGKLKNNGRRSKDTVEYRGLIALDFDSDCVTPSELPESMPFSCFIHSTFKSTDINPRYRVLIPLEANLSFAEYATAAASAADKLSKIGTLDTTSLQYERFMFWPGIPSDGKYFFKQYNGPRFSWKFTKDNVEEAEVIDRISRQVDPRRKKGLIGRFCREFTITECIVEFLSDIYEPGEDDNSYTFKAGSTGSGVKLYDNDRFIYSFHHTDPAGGRLCNAYDLVRIHMFQGDETQTFKFLKDRYESLWYTDKGKFRPVCLAQHMAGTELYLHTNRTWYKYGVVWEMIDEEIIHADIKRHFTHDAKMSHITEVTGLLRCLVHVQEEIFNDVDDLTVFKDGTTLKNFSVTENDPRHKHSIAINSNYDRAATCENFEKFLGQVLTHNNISLLQEMIGLFLTTSLKVKGFFILHGPKDCGKSVLVSLMNEILGAKNISGASVQDICGSGSQFTLGELYGKTVNINSDISNEPIRQTGVLKQLTGDKMISYNRKNKDIFYGRITARLCFVANELPQSRDRNDAFFSRVNIINFKDSVPVERQDKFLIEKLLKEKEGIINWALIGLKRLITNNYQLSGDRRHVEKYKNDSNPVLNFVSETCTLDQNAKVSATEIYYQYKSWCADNGFYCQNSQNFSKELLQQHSSIQRVRSKNARMFKGIKVNPVEMAP